MFAHRLLLVASFALAVATTSLAQSTADRDASEINAYVLTESGLNKYIQATHNLGAAAAQVASHCDEEEGAESLDAAAARVENIPAARTAIEAAGMKAREYIVFSLSLFQSGMAAWALDQPGGKLPDGVSMANVKFYRAHEASIKGLQAAGGKDCEQEPDEQEEASE